MDLAEDTDRSTEAGHLPSKDLLQRKILPGLWIGWLVVYMWIAPAFANPGTSFLAAPLDQPISPWLKMIFLNVPLQALCIFGALFSLPRSPQESVSVAAKVLSAVATLLIIANVAIAVFVGG